MNRNVGEYAIFHVGEMTFGLDIKHVCEINRNLKITRVHLASDYVRGVINLRGQIVTVIDLRRKFDLDSRDFDEWTRVIVVRSSGEDIGLLVDSVEDIVCPEVQRMDRPPPHLCDTLGKYLSGIFRMKGQLVAVLDVERVLQIEDGTKSKVQHKSGHCEGSNAI